MQILLERQCQPIQEALIPSITGHVVAEAPFAACDVICMLAPVSKMFPDAWGGKACRVFNGHIQGVAHFVYACSRQHRSNIAAHVSQHRGRRETHPGNVIRPSFLGVFKYASTV